jgi:hypothetical protein
MLFSQIEIIPLYFYEQNNSLVIQYNSKICMYTFIYTYDNGYMKLRNNNTDKWKKDKLRVVYC